MSNFYESFPLEAAQQLEQLSRLVFELRENRKQLLERYKVNDEAILLQLIQSGTVAEHPAYDHYLSALILTTTREVVRQQMQAVMTELGG